MRHPRSCSDVGLYALGLVLGHQALRTKLDSIHPRTCSLLPSSHFMKTCSASHDNQDQDAIKFQDANDTSWNIYYACISDVYFACSFPSCSLLTHRILQLNHVCVLIRTVCIASVRATTLVIETAVSGRGSGD